MRQRILDYSFQKVARLASSNLEKRYIESGAFHVPGRCWGSFRAEATSAESPSMECTNNHIILTVTNSEIRVLKP
jgi:hypothetical protein